MSATSHGYSVITPPSPPFALSDVKGWLRVPSSVTDDDDLISDLIVAASEQTEDETGRRWMPQVLQMTWHTFPYRSDKGLQFQRDWWPGMFPGYYPVIVIPYEPFQSVVSLSYYDMGGNQQTLTYGTDFEGWLDHSPPLLYPFPGTLWPFTQTGRLPGVTLQFNAGYTDITRVPAKARAAMRLAIGYWYEHRGDSEDPTELGLPAGAIRLLRSLHTGYYS